jgi:large conductance mechanosensitive channel
MAFFKEFKEFITKGNVVDLAIAVVIGAAFGKIITSFVEDVITPLLLNPALKAAKLDKIEDLKTDSGVLYGKFIAAIISFLVIAFVIFLLVKAINKLSKKADEAPAPPTLTETLLMEIRDGLKK